MYIRKFNEGKKDRAERKESNKEVQLNLYNHLTEKEIKLLMLLLDDLADHRGRMTCNDPYKKEERIFTREERIEMNKFLGTTRYMSQEDAEEMEDFMYNNTYPAYIKYKLKSQMP